MRHRLDHALEDLMEVLGQLDSVVLVDTDQGV